MKRVVIKDRRVNLLILGLLATVALSFVLGCQPINTSNDKVNKSSAWQTASGEPVKKGQTLVFPQDHGIHQKQGIEWWYLTANLTATTGETFGVQWTLFRTLLPMHSSSQQPTKSSQISSNWWDNNLYFAHFAIQHEQRHVAFERFARKGQAGVSHTPFVAAIDSWHLASQGASFLPLTLNAQDGDYQLSISLNNSPRVLHGEQGYSQKTGAGHASYYYSYPFLAANGELTFDGKTYQVSGNAWYDREWSASLLDQKQLGWDWFSLVQDDMSHVHVKNKAVKNKDESRKEKSKTTNQLGEARVKGLMLFCIRGKQQTYDYCSGSKISKHGKVIPINQGDININVADFVTLDGREYPSKWHVNVPRMDTITIESITKDSRNQLTFPYWEGRVKASGGLSGLGYAELTGY